MSWRPTGFPFWGRYPSSPRDSAEAVLRVTKPRLRVTKPRGRRSKTSLARHETSTARHETSVARHESPAARHETPAARHEIRLAKRGKWRLRRIRAPKFHARPRDNGMRAGFIAPGGPVSQRGSFFHAGGAAADEKGMENFSFQPRVKGHAMTAAERQRLCRERGKGRHRGYRPTRADLQRDREQQAAAAQAALAAPAQAVPETQAPSPA